MKHKMTVGYMALSKASWKTDKTAALAVTAEASLRSLPHNVVAAPALVTTEAEAEAQARRFKREGVDALVLHFATFPAGAVIPALARELDVPFLLLANPETPSPDGVLEQNSFCGANMASHVLRKLGRRSRFVWGGAAETAAAVAPALRPLACAARLRGAKVGLVGGRVPGFYTSSFDEMRLQATFGVAVEVLDLLEVAELARRLPAVAGVDTLRGCAAQVNNVTDKELSLAGNLLQTLRSTADKYALDALAVRCWPELPDCYGIAPCAVLGALNDAKLPTSCEGDVLGAVTMLAQRSLADGGTPFFADLIAFDHGTNTGVAWHCGAAPPSLCRRFEETTLRKHMRVDGGDKKGVTNDFPLKAGRVTMAQLNETPAGYQMLIAAGTALDTEGFVRGNPLRIKFDGPMRTLVDTIMEAGFGHHYSLIHADLKEPLADFCALLDIKPIIVG